jgi:hypothetical protein
MQGPQATTSDLIPPLEVMLDGQLDEVGHALAPVLGALLGALPASHRGHLLLLLPMLAVHPGEREGGALPARGGGRRLPLRRRCCCRHDSALHVPLGTLRANCWDAAMQADA